MADQKQIDPGLASEELARQAAEDGLNEEMGGFSPNSNGDGRAPANTNTNSNTTNQNSTAANNTAANTTNQNTNNSSAQENKAAAEAAQRAATAQKPAEPVSLGSEALDSVFAHVETSVPSIATQTTATNSQTAATPMTIPDEQLVNFNGRVVPYGEIKSLVYLKEEYDQKLTKLNAEAQTVEARRRAVEAVTTEYIDPLMNTPGGKALLENFMATVSPQNPKGDLNKALDAISPILGRTPPAQNTQAATTQAATDTRLVPPRDASGNPLPIDDPEYLHWQATVYGPALAEQATQRVIDKAETERKDREAKVEAERLAAQRDADQKANFRKTVRDGNLNTLQKIGDILKDKGVDLKKLGVTKAQFNTELAKTFDYAAENDMDFRSQQWLEENQLTEGQLRTLVDATGLTTRLQRANENPMDPTVIARNLASGTNGSSGANTQAAAQQNGQAVGDVEGRRWDQRRPPIGAMGPGDTKSPAGPDGRGNFVDARAGVESAAEELKRTAMSDGLGFAN